MSTPTPVTPKAPRSARRHQKRVDLTTPSTNLSYSDNQQSSFQTPPSSPPDSSSVEALTDGLPNNTGSSTARKKNGRSAKKNKAAVKASPAPNSTTGGHRHTSSQPSIISPPGAKDNAHYAGPTFHASPAPSALPIPSFFSKSVPDTDHSESELGGDLPELCPPDATPSKPKNHPKNDLKTEEKAPEQSPLDFLFKAAREARDVNGGSPRTRSEKHSPPLSNKKPHWYDQSEGASGGVFPLELEGSDTQASSIGPSFATPYKDRMNALRSASSPSRPTCSMDLEEDQRKAKTEALKTLLLNPRPQRPASASPHRDQQRMFTLPNTSSPSTPREALPSHHTSLSPSHVSSDGSEGRFGPLFDPRGNGNVAHQYISSVSNNPHKPRTPSSNLRQEVSLSSPNSRTNLNNTIPVGPGRTPSTQARFFQNSTSSLEHPSPIPYWKSPPSSGDSSLTHQFSPSPKAMDTTRMEDDLRRILKLDITGGLKSNGVQSPVA